MGGALDRLSDAARDAAEAVRLRDLQDALTAVAEVVDSPQYVLCGFEGEGRFVLHAGAGDIVPTFDDYVRGIYPTDPLQLRLMELSRFPLVATHESLGVDVRAFRRSDAYQHYFRTVAVDRMLVCTLTDQPYGAPDAYGMMFTRPADRDDFEEADARAVAAVLPSFVSAVRRHVRFREIERERDHLAAAAESGDARVLFDTRGHVTWRSSATSWLGEAVPDAVVVAAGRLGALAAGGSLVPGTSEKVAGVLSDGRALSADLSIVRTRGGEPLVEARLAPAGLGPGLLAQVAQRFGLTRAEADVLNALLRGETNPEAAKRLFVSLETIRTHVHRVLSKLSVSSRHDVAGVVARWYQGRPR